MYRFRMKKIKVNTIDERISIVPKKINVIIGPNNSGKSRFLKEIRNFFNGNNKELKIIEGIEYDFPDSLSSLNESYDVASKMSRDFWGNWMLRVYSGQAINNWDINASLESYNTKNLNVIGGDWEEFLNNIIKNKEYCSFFQQCGSLFYQYLGTEERLIICKMQKNYGLDSNNTNYLTAYKFEEKLLQGLSEHVKKIFNRDIILDTQTLGDRLVFRIGDDFSYIKGILGNDNGDITKLLNESILDDQGDGLKSFVSTYLSLNSKEKDVLLIDEPEAFLHPPLARQMGEMIGEFQEDAKQVFVATHSVEILKGILSKNTDVNIIRIIQPESNKNRITIIDKEILTSILETPLLRVSRILEGLFCEKVIVTEAEADELIYQELIEKMWSQSGLYFAHGQNKQTLAEIVELYQNIGIQYEVITDFDVLRKNDEFNKFLKKMNLDEEVKQRYRGYIIELREFIESQVDITGLDKEAQKDVLKKAKDKVYHEWGLNYLEGELKKKIEELLNEMCQQHLHILPSGELETLLVPLGINYTHNKGKWAVDAINKIAELEKETILHETSIMGFLSGIIG